MAERKVISTDKGPAAIGPYSQAIVANGMVFCSGMIAMHPVEKKLVGGGDVSLEARQCLENMKAVLEAAGSNLSKVVKCMVLLTDINDFAKVNAVYGEYFPSNPPARATYAVLALPASAKVEIVCDALL